MPTPPSPAAEFMAAYQRSVARKDAAAFADLYDEEARMFDAWDTWRLQGNAAVRAMATAWLGSLGDARVEVSFADVQEHVDADVAAASALVTYTALGADGTRLGSRTNRMSVVLRRRAAGWRVVHEHTSVPVGFGSGQAILEPDA